MLELFTMSHRNLNRNIISITFCLFSTILILFAFSVNPKPASASGSASYSITPSNGFVTEGSRFTIDVLIDTAGTEVTQARAVITFDPTRVRLYNASRNNSLFAQFPTDGQSTDNTNGVVMVTGFSQSGEDELYATSGEPDVFVRLTFDALRSGTVQFEWEYSGSDQPFKSVIMANGSPPQNILNTRPQSATFTIQASSTTPPPVVPDTAVRDYLPLYVGGITLIGGALIFFGGNMLVNASENVKSSKKRTVVDYD